MGMRACNAAFIPFVTAVLHFKSPGLLSSLTNQVAHEVSGPGHCPPANVESGDIDLPASISISLISGGRSRQCRAYFAMATNDAEMNDVQPQRFDDK